MLAFMAHFLLGGLAEAAKFGRVALLGAGRLGEGVLRGLIQGPGGKGWLRKPRPRIIY